MIVLKGSPDKQNKVISKEKVGDARPSKSDFDWGPKVLVNFILNHSRKSSHIENEKIGKDGVSLPDTPRRFEKGCGLPINED